MCPVCFSSLVLLITGGVSMLGVTAGGASKIWKLRTRENSKPSQSVSKNKGEMRWQQARQEKRNTEEISAR